MRNKLFLVIAFLGIGLNGCSAQEEEKVIKNYQLYLDSADPSAQIKLQSLIGRFNDAVGFTALDYTTTKSNEVSKVHLVRSLSRDENAAGMGGAREQYRAPEVSNGNFQQVRLKTMELWFDYDAYMKEYSNDHLYMVFCHEVGHGIELLHSSDKLSVMFSDGEYGNYDYDNTNWNTYYDRVQAYFRDDFVDWNTYDAAHPAG